MTLSGYLFAKLLIAYYDGSFTPRDVGVSRFIGKIGAYSYSIYLLHAFVVFRAGQYVHQHIMDLSNFYVACVWATLFFGLMVPFGWLSFRYIETPFLRLRRPYFRSAGTAVARQAA